MKKIISSVPKKTSTDYPYFFQCLDTIKQALTKETEAKTFHSNTEIIIIFINILSSISKKEIAFYSVNTDDSDFPLRLLHKIDPTLADGSPLYPEEPLVSLSDKSRYLNLELDGINSTSMFFGLWDLKQGLEENTPENMRERILRIIEALPYRRENEDAMLFVMFPYDGRRVGFFRFSQFSTSKRLLGELKNGEKAKKKGGEDKVNRPEYQALRELMSFLESIIDKNNEKIAACFPKNHIPDLLDDRTPYFGLNDSLQCASQHMAYFDAITYHPCSPDTNSQIFWSNSYETNWAILQNYRAGISLSENVIKLFLEIYGCFQTKPFPNNFEDFWGACTTYLSSRSNDTLLTLPRNEFQTLFDLLTHLSKLNGIKNFQSIISSADSSHKEITTCVMEHITKVNDLDVGRGAFIQQQIEPYLRMLLLLATHKMNAQAQKNLLLNTESNRGEADLRHSKFREQGIRADIEDANNIYVPIENHCKEYIGFLCFRKLFPTSRLALKPAQLGSFVTSFGHFYDIERVSLGTLPENRQDLEKYQSHQMLSDSSVKRYKGFYFEIQEGETKINEPKKSVRAHLERQQRAKTAYNEVRNFLLEKYQGDWRIVSRLLSDNYLNAGRAIIIRTEAGKMIGFVTSTAEQDGIYLNGMIVADDYEQQGIATHAENMLVWDDLHWFKDKILCFRTQTPETVRIARRLGSDVRQTNQDFTIEGNPYTESDMKFIKDMFTRYCHLTRQQTSELLDAEGSGILSNVYGRPVAKTPIRGCGNLGAIGVFFRTSKWDLAWRYLKLRLPYRGKFLDAVLMLPGAVVASFSAGFLLKALFSRRT